LRLQANDLLLEDVSSNKFLKGSAGGTVQIWHNAAGHPAAKLTTSAAGVEINGTVTADSYIIDDGTFKTTIVENASSDIILTLPSSAGTLATLADVQAEDTLAEMNDVNLTSPSDGSFLQYDNASSKWIDTQTIVQTANGVNVTGNIAVTGNVDGQDVAHIGTKATTAHGWGNHASAGYLTSFTETNDLSAAVTRSEEHTSELQSHSDLVCRLLLEKKKQSSSDATVTAPTRLT